VVTIAYRPAAKIAPAANEEDWPGDIIVSKEESRSFMLATRSEDVRYIVGVRVNAELPDAN